MFHATINAKESIALFHKLLQADSRIRMLFLEGASKMGKSHLLSKVFFVLASQQYQAYCVIIDLKRQPLTIPDILNSASEDLGEHLCPLFKAATKEKMKHSDMNVVFEKALTLGSRIDISVPSSGIERDFQLWNFHLTTQFVTDVSRLCHHNRLIVFLVDNVNCATDNIRAWMMDTFLKQLARLSDVRVVIAGQSLPEANTGYVAVCEYYHLSSITNLGEYITYCENSNEKLLEETIKVVAVLSDFNPGFFVENMLKIHLAKLV
jgi:hypothetical protein